MTYYDEQLQRLQQQVARKAHLETILRDLHSQKDELEKKVDQLKIEKQKEQTDVDRLEGRSLAAFFYNIAGKKEEKLDKERQEAYAATVKYDSASRELTAIKEDMNRYEGELSTLTGCNERYEQVLKEKAAAVKSSGTPEVSKMLQLEEQINYLENQKKEINEAISAGNEAAGMAEKVLSNLDDAEGWGTWDLLGGGLIADLAKYSSLDDAQESVEQLQVQLRRFKTELADVTIQADMQVNVDGFLRFADYFFDGFIMDWTVLDRISESQGQVQKTKTQIEDVLNTLTSMLSAIEEEQDQTKSKLDELILKAKL
ncbi:MAG: hypothetical protein IJA10_12425 [Lachnospiraceae bacterium]|nr:hypothetical protein [Lachnospiraceae bacterium]